MSWSCGGPGDPSHTNQQPWSVLCDFSKPAILASFHFCLFLLFFFFVPFSLFLSGFPLFFYFPFILFVPFFPLIFCQIFFFFFFFAAFLVGFPFASVQIGPSFTQTLHCGENIFVNINKKIKNSLNINIKIKNLLSPYRGRYKGYSTRESRQNTDCRGYRGYRNKIT